MLGICAVSCFNWLRVNMTTYLLNMYAGFSWPSPTVMILNWNYWNFTFSVPPNFSIDILRALNSQTTENIENKVIWGVLLCLDQLGSDRIHSMAEKSWSPQIAKNMVISIFLWFGYHLHSVWGIYLVDITSLSECSRGRVNSWYWWQTHKN